MNSKLLESACGRQLLRGSQGDMEVGNRQKLIKSGACIGLAAACCPLALRSVSKLQERQPICHGSLERVTTLLISLHEKVQ